MDLVKVLDATLSCINSRQLVRLAELAYKAEYAGAQLGTRSQIAAHDEYQAFLKEIFETMPATYVKETKAKVERALKEK